MIRNMVRVHVILDNYAWELFCFFSATHYDTDEIMEHLWEIGCDGSYAYKAYQNLSANKLNSGLTYSSPVRRKSVIVTAQTESPDEFFNSLVHEISHCAIHIANVLYIDKNSEEFAYLMGDLNMTIFPHIKHLLCDCCRENA